MLVAVGTKFDNFEIITYKIDKMFKIGRLVSQQFKSTPIQCKCLSTIKPPSGDAPKSEPVPSEITPKKYDSNEVAKADLEWRSPWHQRESHRYNTLRTFYSEESNTSVIKFLQTPINFTPSGIKNWWVKKGEHTERMMQSYIPERNRTLGNELAAAHFVVHRGGAVKFHGSDKWIKADKRNRYTLPRHFQDDMFLEAIDCSDMNLYYEGLANLGHLKSVEWLSFNAVERLDDWFLDRISNQFSHCLIYLDLRNCPNYSERGLGALYKMDNLKFLRIDDMRMTEAFEMTCLLLQEVNPDLDIKIGE